MFTQPSLPWFHPVTLLSTWFGCGLLPHIPGTWGSIAALPFAWLLIAWGGWISLLLAAAALFPIGIWASGRYELAAGRDDPGEVVIDEVVGQWIALAPPAIWIPDMPALLFASIPSFLLFRVFDIWKPWPVNAFERRYKAGLGIMIDDVIAGLYVICLIIFVTLAFAYLSR